MNQVYLYLSATQRESCLRALNTAQRWTQGDVGVFAELADAGFLRDKDGKNLSLSLWSTIVEPALTEYANLVAGTTPGTILDVHDPATHPLAAVCWRLQQQWAAAKVSRKCTTLAALPSNLEVHKIDTNAFDLYHQDKNRRTLHAQGLTSKQVVEVCNIDKPVFKLAVGQDNVHRLLAVLDIYSRILMNQWEYVKELTDDRWEKRRDDWHEQVENAVKEFKEPWTGYSMNAASGIHGPNIHPEANLVFTVKKALRHWDMVQRLGYTHRRVSTDAPMEGEAWPLIDGDVSAGLEVLPVGAGIVLASRSYYVVETYKPMSNPEGTVLAVSYNPVSLLNSLAYTQANPAASPLF